MAQVSSRDCVSQALNHIQPDRLPLDLGSCTVTGMHVSMVYKLRQVLGLDKAGTPVKVIEPYQMLGEIAPDLQELIGVDVVGVMPQSTLFGFKNENWKQWQLFDGTPVLVPGGFNTIPEPDGSLLLYPEGDKSVPPSGRMPAGGNFFDSIVRQGPIDDKNLAIEDNLQEFGYITDETLNWFGSETKRLYENTDKAILATFGGTAFGDIALVPAPWLKHPKGIRDVEEWYVSTAIRRDYVYRVFEKQCEIALSNFQKLYKVVGEKIAAVFLTGTDFGTQNGLFVSPKVYCDLYQPFHKKINDWVHKNTQWKCFMHSCGAILELIPHFIDSGFDILNPVQCSAKGMHPEILKRCFGNKITFWGGGIETQNTLAFGTPGQVRDEVLKRIEIFNINGGFIFNPVHNVQANTPIQNLLAVYSALNEYRGYKM
jgi:hypothetical protein